MKKLLLVLVVAASSLFGQVAGDYQSVTSGLTTDASTWQVFNGTTWDAAVTGLTATSSTVNVFIRNGHTININGTTSCVIKNLTIDAGGVLTQLASNARSITITGGTIQCDGSILSVGTTDRPIIQWDLVNCVLQGSGSAIIYRVRPKGATTASTTFTFNMDCELLEGGAYTNSILNANYTVASGKVLTLTNSYFGGGSSKTNSSTNNFTITVDGTVNVNPNSVPSYSAINLNTTSAQATLNVNGTLNFATGTALNATTGSPIINILGTLNTDAALTLADGSNVAVIGSGKITGSSGSLTIVKSFTSPSAADALGAKITSSADLGSTSIVVGFVAQTGGSNQGIKRWYDITPTTNTGLNATLVFNYSEGTELNGITETNLVPYKSTDGGTTWAQQSGALDDVANTVTITGIDDFSRWTLGDVTNPMPVELVSFNAIAKGKSIELRWNTATETNNSGFEVQKNVGGTWNKIGFVEGAGTSNAPKQYSYSVSVPASGKYSFRLKQIDRDGKFTYSNEVEASITLTAQDYSLSQNYPNPFNPSTTFSFAMKNGEQTTVKVFNLVGQEVATLFNGVAEPNKIYTMKFDGSSLSSGIYFYSLRSGSRYEMKKMMLLK